MQKIVNVLGISLRYQSDDGEIPAIADLSMDVAEGEFLSIVGPSGCGKSTLLSVLAGLLPPDAGQVLLQGDPITGPHPAVGLMPQRDALLPWRTVRSNVLLGQDVSHSRNREAEAYADALLSAYGLSGFAQKYPSELSGGMRQRAALIRTLATQPALLLLDEPFSSLDYQTRITVAADIHRIIKQQQKTAVMVTHDLSEALSVSDRILVLSRRPASVKRIFVSDFGSDVPPLARREHPAFAAAFEQLWRELDVHV